jgi:hypothetical protein
MSRGFGKIERWIGPEIARGKARPKPTAVLIPSKSLAYHYPHSDRDWKPSGSQRRAVVQAMHSFVRKFPQYALIGGQGGKQLYLYEPSDPVSAAWAKLTMERHNHVTRIEAEAYAKKAAQAVPGPRP